MGKKSPAARSRIIITGKPESLRPQEHESQFPGQQELLGTYNLRRDEAGKHITQRTLVSVPNTLRTTNAERCHSSNIYETTTTTPTRNKLGITISRMSAERRSYLICLSSRNRCLSVEASAIPSSASLAARPRSSISISTPVK